MEASRALALFIITILCSLEISHSKEHNVEFCQQSKTFKESYWRDVVKINLLQQQTLSGEALLPKEILLNNAITSSYLNFFIKAQSTHSEMMGYIYAHASHHLGRLIRLRHWNQLSRNSRAYQEIGVIDKNFIKGERLLFFSQLFPQTLSKLLMHYSYQLYIEIAWPLIASDQCSNERVISISRNENLIRAFQSSDLIEFMEYYILYEQEFLQKTLYANPLMAQIAKAGILDKMRFIPFDDQLNLSFSEWCQQRSCQHTSFDLDLRVQFDQEVITNHLKKGELTLKKDSLINRIVNYFKDLHH